MHLQEKLSAVLPPSLVPVAALVLAMGCMAEGTIGTPSAGQPAIPHPNFRADLAPVLLEEEMPTAVREILERRCTACHTYGSRDAADWGSVLDLNRMINADVIVPGDPERSRLWDRIAIRADMPFNGDRLTSEEVLAIKTWITTMTRPLSGPRSNEQILDAIAQDQQRLGSAGTDARYLSLAPFIDEGRTATELTAARGALLFALNSLSRRSAIVDLVPIDEGESLYRFRLSELGWSRGTWDDVVRAYPYCLASAQTSHRALYSRLQTEAPYLRGDWFAATATRSPLYERLLQIPQTLDELARDLGVDIEDNINHPGRGVPAGVARYGFRASGVSKQNRVIERHPRRAGGYLWVSYDFDSNLGRGDILENPLGPRSISNRGFTRTFEHAGGEVIYSLPNGLQGYLLVNNQGTRIDVAPLAIVRDQRRRSGAVENALSCMTCHSNTGMNRARDQFELATFFQDRSNGLSTSERDEVRRLYPRQDGTDFVAQDAGRWRDAIARLGEFAPRANGGVEYDDLIILVGQYEANLGLRGAAVELGLTPDALQRELARLGSDTARLFPQDTAAPLFSRDAFTCVYRDVARRIHRDAAFCRNSFIEPAVVAACNR
jgi:hypothetical protein